MDLLSHQIAQYRSTLSEFRDTGCFYDPNSLGSLLALLRSFEDQALEYEQAFRVVEDCMGRQSRETADERKAAIQRGLEAKGLAHLVVPASELVGNVVPFRPRPAPSFPQGGAA